MLQVHAVNINIMDISNYTDFTVAQHHGLTTNTVIAVLDALIIMEVSHLIF